jgi:hypothetical protein
LYYVTEPPPPEEGVHSKKATQQATTYFDLTKALLQKLLDASLAPFEGGLFFWSAGILPAVD